jgi:hypothetical protein
MIARSGVGQGTFGAPPLSAAAVKRTILRVDEAEHSGKEASSRLVNGMSGALECRYVLMTEW